MIDRAARSSPLATMVAPHPIAVVTSDISDCIALGTAKSTANVNTLSSIPCPDELATKV